MKISGKMVYPPHGLVIVGTPYQGSEGVTYDLRLVSNESTVFMVPAKNFGKIGIRKLSPKRDVRRAKEILARPRPKDWSYKQEQEMVKKANAKGDLCSLAFIVNSLSLGDQEYHLGFYPRMVLRRAMAHLTEEIAAVMNVTQAEVKEEVEAALAKASGESTYASRRERYSEPKAPRAPVFRSRPLHLQLQT
jgi:RNA polymerase-interacting CarD/CdnL/TRCF family regulator